MAFVVSHAERVPKDVDFDRPQLADMSWLALLLAGSLAATRAANRATTAPAQATGSPQLVDLASWTVGWRFWLLLTGTMLTVGGLLIVEWAVHRRNRLPAVQAASVTPRPSPGGLVFALRYYQGLRTQPGSPSGASPAGPPAANPPLGSLHYELVEYRSESWNSEVQPRTLGQFRTLEAAIDSGRRARSSFALDSPAEAFWVVWSHQLKRAAWIAESGTPGENIIDLTIRRRDPSITESTRTR